MHSWTKPENGRKNCKDWHFVLVDRNGVVSKRLKCRKQKQDFKQTTAFWKDFPGGRWNCCSMWWRWNWVPFQSIPTLSLRFRLVQKSKAILLEVFHLKDPDTTQTPQWGGMTAATSRHKPVCLSANLKLHCSTEGKSLSDHDGASSTVLRKNRL